MNPPRRVVLDTDVLFSRIYHETYGYLGAEAVVRVLWPDPILEELHHALTQQGRTTAHAEAVCGFVRAGFAEDQVETDGTDGTPYVTDPGDAHIAAAAIAGNAEAIITRNHRHYRTSDLAAHGIAVIDPTDHLVAIANYYPQDTGMAIERQAAASSVLRSPAALLDLFEARGHAGLADGLRRALSG